MKRSSTLKRTGRRESAKERERRHLFNSEVLCMATCLFKEKRPGHVCEGPLDAHHLIEKQFMRRHFAGHPDLLEIVWDPAIGIPLCRAAHDLITRHLNYVFLEECPAQAVDFAEGHGIRWRLEHECPSLGAE